MFYKKLFLVLTFFTFIIPAAFSTSKVELQEDQSLHHHHSSCVPIACSTVVATDSSPLVKKPNLYDDIPGTRVGTLLRWSIRGWTVIEIVSDAAVTGLSVAGIVFSELASCDDDMENPWSYTNISKYVSIGIGVAQFTKLAAGSAIKMRERILRRLWISYTGSAPINLESTAEVN